MNKNLYIIKNFDIPLWIKYWLLKRNKLPKEYEKLEYIESTGTQYIDTGITLNENLSLEITGRLVNLENGSSLFGVVASGYVSYLQLLVINNYYAGRFIYANTQSGNYTRISNVSYLDNKLHKFKLSHKNGFYIDNNKIGEGSSYNYNLGSKLPLFGFRNINSNSVSISNCIISEFKQFDSENDKILLKHLIPCRNKINGEIGMFDLINKEFYKNSGSGIFNYKEKER